MNYDQLHLLTWLNNRPLINISKLEEASNCPKGTIRHFLKERRGISNIHLASIEKALYAYGYGSLNNE